ncbi:MAG: hypothetical protein A2358_03225, partial [Candidatus Staskawiczbacteria bacterium RIFOXYB1_FULL_37_44]
LQQPTDVFDLKIACSGECLTRGVKQGVEIDYIVDPWACGDALVDSRDSQSYATVLIGNQCWMRENLNVGTRIAGASNQTDNATLEKYCYSNNDANCTTYGGLYQWNEAMQYTASCNGTGAPPNDACASPVQGICPTGWHIPSHYEFTTLGRAVCTSGSCATDFPYDTETDGWIGTNEGTTLKTVNSSSFSALFGGALVFGTFGQIGTDGLFWSSLEGQNSSNVWNLQLAFANARVSRAVDAKAISVSIRCIRSPVTNTAPALTSVATSPNPIQGGSTLTITPTGQADDDSDALYYYCNETGSATSADTLCTQANTSYATPYSSMTCSYAVSTGNTTRTVYCRTYDGTEYSSEVTATYTVDTTAPTVSDVSSIATDSTATITWTTNEAGSTMVEYGTTTNYGTSTTETDTSTRVTSHSVSLSNLSSCTAYHYRVRSTDSVSNETIGEDNTFTTTGCGGALPAIAYSKEDQINQIMQKLIGLIKQAIKLISEKAGK